MMLKVIIEDQLYELNIPEAFIDQADDYFQRMDRDMDQGWQMGREWVANPDGGQRCRIVADKLLNAIEQKNDVLGRLMAGYIVSRMPAVETIKIDTDGEIQNTTFTLREGQPAGHESVSAVPAGGMDDTRAREQAEKEFSEVFKVGRNWRFAVYDNAADQWRESPLAGSEEEARRLRDQAVQQRLRALTAGDG
jgi:hypothetical protein